MFERLDSSLAALLADVTMPTALQALRTAAVSFETPGTFTPDRGTVNLFLYETRENRELRDPVPMVEPRNGLSVRRTAAAARRLLLHGHRLVG